MRRGEAGTGLVLDAGDAADLVRSARCAGVRIATETAGRGGVDAATIVVRTDRLDRITVCPRSRIARVGAGVSAADLAAALARHGLISAADGSAHERVVDLALTGGIGRFARKYGTASGGVTAFEVVDADGNVLRASAHENEDLFWALAGGGAGFGLVTAVEVQSHAEPDVFGGTMTWPAAVTSEVLAALSDIVASAPEELSVRVTAARIPGTAPTVSVSAAFLGSDEEARVVLKPFAEIGGFAQDPAEPVEPLLGRARAVVVSGLDDASDLMDIVPAVQLRQLGGRLAEASANGPHGALDGEFAVFLAGSAAQQEAAVAALGDAAKTRTPLAWLGADEPASRAFGGAELERLREVKAAWDPDGVFVAGPGGG